MQQTPGYLSGVGLHAHSTIGGETCDFELVGSLRGVYDHAAGDLAIDSLFDGLTLTNVASSNPSAPLPLCDVLGFFDGDTAAAAGSLRLSPAPTIS